MATKTSTGKYWVYFVIWFAVITFLLVTPSVRQFFWLALPGVCTSFAKGLDII